MEGGALGYPPPGTFNCISSDTDYHNDNIITVKTVNIVLFKYALAD